MYKVIRFHSNGPSRAVRNMSGLTLEQAQAHCSRDDTHAKGVCSDCHYTAKTYEENNCPTCGHTLHRAWFDGYTET